MLRPSSSKSVAVEHRRRVSGNADASPYCGVGDSGAMRKAATTTELVTSARLAQARAAGGLGAAVTAVHLAAIATAANDNLCAAAGAHKEAACGRHRQSPSMPKRPRRGGSGVPYWHGTVPRRTRVGLDTGINLAVRTGVGPASSAVCCSRSSTASRSPRHPLANRTAFGASTLALRAPSGAPNKH
jgi:hypothetical protein